MAKKINRPWSAYNADRGLFSRHIYYSADFPYWQKKWHFLMILFIKMSFFHYNIAKAFFCYKIERHRIWKEWKKYSITKDFESFIYYDKGIYKSIKILGWNSERSSMLHPKGTWRIFDKEKSNIFSNDFANGKIDTIMGLATLYLHMWKECIKNGGSKPPPYIV